MEAGYTMFFREREPQPSQRKFNNGSFEFDEAVLCWLTPIRLTKQSSAPAPLPLPAECKVDTSSKDAYYASFKPFLLNEEQRSYHRNCWLVSAIKFLKALCN